MGEFVETLFGEGSLGVVLRRRAEDGIVFVHEIIPDSQAVHINVLPGDELWTVGDSEIGQTPLDKEAWNGLIAFIKQSNRPLRMIWHRKSNFGVEDKALEEQSQQFSSTSGCESTIANQNGSNSCLKVDELQEEQPTSQDYQSSPHFQELSKVLSRISNKEKDSTSSLASFLTVGTTQSKRGANLPDPMSLLVDGRRILRIGDLNSESKPVPPLWLKSVCKRRVILMNDLLLVAIPAGGNMLSLEYLIDLPISKINSFGHSFGLAGVDEESVKASDIMEETLSFEVVWPGGDVKFIAENRESKDIWILNIFLAICETVAEEGRVLGWRHQYLLGTMHSAVLSRSEERVRELILYHEQRNLPYSFIDMADQDGYTPLHYACMLRLTSTVKLLYDSKANILLIDKHGFTAIHWAAMQLDICSLRILCSHVKDVNCYDASGRNPLVLLCVEGRDISGTTDFMMLKDCVEILLVHQPFCDWRDELGNSIVHYVASSWQCAALELILDYDCRLINSVENVFEMTPLLIAARGMSIKRAIGEGHKLLNQTKQFSMEQLHMVEDLSKTHAIDTLRSLLKHGAKPNQKDKLGRSLLHILLEPEALVHWDNEELLQNAISLALSYGARPDEQILIILKTRFPNLNFGAVMEKWSSLSTIDGKIACIRLNQFDSEIVDGDEVKAHGSKSVNNCVCELCGFVFTMFRRQHHCRLCSCSCCDDCSRKRISIEFSQVRVCDCCYNRTLGIVESIQHADGRTASVSNSSHKNSRQDVSDQKMSLFGNNSSNVNVNVNSELNTTGQSKTAATMSLMNDTYEKLQERGEKLNRLADRTEDMVNQASEFARLAKQLNEQQKSRWF